MDSSVKMRVNSFRVHSDTPVTITNLLARFVSTPGLQSALCRAAGRGHAYFEYETGAAQREVCGSGYGNIVMWVFFFETLIEGLCPSLEGTLWFERW